MKRILAVAAVTVAALGLAAPAATAAPALCTHLSVTVNDQNQTIDQCLPPA